MFHCMYAPPATRKNARQLRRVMTPPEVRLWQSLRRSTQGLRFRRQHPFGPYVLDFYCASAGLCVEVDGQWHTLNERRSRDLARDLWLERGGVLTLRVTAKSVFENPTNVIDAITGFAIEHHRMAPPTTLF